MEGGVEGCIGILSRNTENQKSMEERFQNSWWKLLSTQCSIDRAVLECQAEEFVVYCIINGKPLNIFEQGNNLIRTVLCID